MAARARVSAIRVDDTGWVSRNSGARFAELPLIFPMVSKKSGMPIGSKPADERMLMPTRSASYSLARV